MKLTEIMTLFEYNYWADYKLLDAASKVSHEQFIAPGPFPWGGLRGTLVHTLDAEYGWHLLMHHGNATYPDLQESEFPGFTDLEQRWHSEETLMRAYLASLDDDAVNGIIRYTADTGQKRERVLWHCLFHVVNHGTQHRSETASLLTDLGRSPGDVDFTVFMNEQALSAPPPQVA